MLFQPRHKNWILFEAPADNGGGGGTPTPENNGGGQPAGDPPNGAAGIADFEAWLKDQPEEVRKAYESHTTGLKSALQTERETRKKLEDDRKAAEKLKADADADAAKKNGEWQKLAEQREKELSDLTARVTELEPMRERAEKYEAALKAQLDEAKKAVPAHILPLLEKLSVEEQLTYIAANAAQFKTGAGGPHPTPPPSDPSDADKANREKGRKQHEQTVRNMFS